MADYHIEGLYEWFRFWDAWNEWASKKPSLWHPIKYIKWLKNEPKH